ncbi:TRAP transporter substrate-binding protein [Muricoccus pecuniae]|uniref:Tripartite ATP-independent transporter DctP family solute receptor n=1 Tax=Muricoccus pecuniae TaxID=693023 RepID=A0A840YJ39_9PROT|nr:TRAP transporter substrate-binding protein [Roseomonas pecuniae]MBB5694133.1 tripartite ATP-independent transporter DctP family solute receptor [Roseomonas pecuniae]
MITSRTTRRAALLGTLGLLSAPAVLRAQGQVRLTLGHGAAPGNPRSLAAERLAATLRERSNGRIEMRVAGSAQLGDDAAMLTALRTGTLDISVNSQGASSAVLPELAAVGMPFLFSGAAAAHKVMDGPIGEELARRFEGVGLVALGWWDNGVRHTTNSKRAINRPEDLRGLKVRTPPDPMTIDIFQALGAATQQINFNELYVALQQGVVDGQENPLANIQSSKIYEVNRFVSLTGHKWECNPFLVSRIAWGRLRPDDQRLLREAAKEAELHQRTLSQEIDAKLLGEFRANPNVSVNEVNQAPFRTVTASVAEKWEARPFGDFVKRLRATAVA